MSSENFPISTALPVRHFDIFTLFPAMFCGPMSESIIRRFQDTGWSALCCMISVPTPQISTMSAMTRPMAAAAAWS